ncbi:Uncharacterised protein [Mycobacteroides abscessus subsp. abscessus]|nr:Uncharacterised protein [Mycobacteroides abscessus subsp. abscessus]
MPVGWFWIHPPDECQRRPRDQRGRSALECAQDDKDQQRRSESAQHGREHEEKYADPVRAQGAIAVGDRPGTQQQCTEGDQVGADDPLLSGDTPTQRPGYIR